MIIPKYISFHNWAASLQIDYPFDTIPIVPLTTSEEEWKNWGGSLVSSQSFSKRNVQGPSDEKTWQEWAYKVYQIMSGG
jgi:hypothetical protein